MLKEYTCLSCGEQFSSGKNKQVCLECLQSENKMFNVIRNYLYAHHGASPNEVVQATGISVSVIMRFLKEGRLETTGNIKLINCEECGKPIDYGRLCNQCEMAKTHELTSVSKHQKGKTKTTMYTQQKK